MSTSTTTRRSILLQAWPIILANAAVPMLGLADTAVLGRYGSVAELGAIAVGALIFSFVYWTFGFLRMSTTGFIAQARGAKDEPEVRATLARALLMGVQIGALLIALVWPIQKAAFYLLSASPGVEAVALEYFRIRIWGAPATLGTYALMGTFIGLGQGRHLLLTQLFVNLVNIGLDVWFGGFLGWGASGIALGTAIAEWCAFGLALGLAYASLRHRQTDQETFWPWQRIKDRKRLLEMLSSNADIMIRTLLLLGAFAWFTNTGARFGDAVLAANHVLLQFLSFSAFFLDGYAFVAESLVGSAIGGRDRQRFELAIRRSTELAAATALVLAAGVLFLGPAAVQALTSIEAVHTPAMHALPLAALYVAVGFAAFQLDGIFIGAAWTRQMRNASVISFAIFLAVGWPLTRSYGNQGLWTAFVLYVLARAATLGAYYPALKRRLFAMP